MLHFLRLSAEEFGAGKTMGGVSEQSSRSACPDLAAGVAAGGVSYGS